MKEDSLMKKFYDSHRMLIYSTISIIWMFYIGEATMNIFDKNNLFFNVEKLKDMVYVLGVLLLLSKLVNQNSKLTKSVVNNMVTSYEELTTAYEEIVSMQEILSFQYKEIQEKQRALEESDLKYKLALEGSKDSLWYWEIDRNRFMFENTKKILGYDNLEIEDSMNGWKKLIHEDDLEKVMKKIEIHIQNKTDYYKAEYRAKTRSGNYRWILSRGKAIMNNKGEAIKMAGSHTDITNRKKTEEKIRQLAYYDYLTGIPNRVLFEEELKNQLKYAKSSNNKFSIIYLDLDNFKNINDILGHSYGDEFLKDFAKYLRTIIKVEDFIARLGGDEFSILVKEELSAMEVVKGIMNYFQKPWKIEYYEFYISASIGIVNYPEHGSESEFLLKNMDIALNHAKVNGKNCFYFYTDMMNEKIIKKMDMEYKLRRAIENEEFALYYQPLIDFNSGKIIGLEALIRWCSPTMGMIAPMEFIPLAEESGLIIEIGQWVIENACQQSKEWIDKGYDPITISVNLSAKQFKQKDLVGVIENILKTTKINPKYLEIEVTETIAMNDIDSAILILNSLKKLGIKISLDDFGTGYSSLSYLKKLPIDTLKIDKSFISDINVSIKEKEIVKGMINLAHKMKLIVTAEGIENVEQMTFLKNQNCDKGQGYIFSKPLDNIAIEKIINKGDIWI